MAKRQIRKRKPATSSQGREDQLVSLAYDLAEKQMEDGTASSQVITHFLKSGSGREVLERRRLEGENALLREKVESMASARRVEELYAEALDAMRLYSGRELQEEDEEL